MVKTRLENRKAFTLLELLLVMLLVGILLGASVTVSMTLFQQNNRIYDAQVITGALRHSRLKAVAGEADSNWGIYLTTDFTTVFSGNTYATRDTQYDQPVPFSTASNITGDSEIVFSIYSGNTTPASIDIETEGQTITIDVNELGIITQH